MKPCLYIMTNKPYGVLYTGMTAGLADRIEKHLGNQERSFVTKYKLHRLVYVEYHNSIEQAALREKQVKEWKRDWKIRLIESINPDWQDLKEKAEYFY